MRTIHAHLADPSTGPLATDPVRIEINLALPIFDYTEADQGLALMSADAGRLAGALIDTLPGATVDALLRELLGRKASQLRVRIPGSEFGPEEVPRDPRTEALVAVRAAVRSFRDKAGFIAPEILGDRIEELGEQIDQLTKPWADE